MKIKRQEIIFVVQSLKIENKWIKKNYKKKLENERKNKKQEIKKYKIYRKKY